MLFRSGIVSKKEPSDEDFMIEINFDTYGMKRLMASFARLKQIE